METPTGEQRELQFTGAGGFAGTQAVMAPSPEAPRGRGPEWEPGPSRPGLSHGCERDLQIDLVLTSEDWSEKSHLLPGGEVGRGRGPSRDTAEHLGGHETARAEPAGVPSEPNGPRGGRRPTPAPFEGAGLREDREARGSTETSSRGCRVPPRPHASPHSTSFYPRHHVRLSGKNYEEY